MKLKQVSEAFCVTNTEKLLYNICAYQKEILRCLKKAEEKHDLGRD